MLFKNNGVKELHANIFHVFEAFSTNSDYNLMFRFTQLIFHAQENIICNMYIVENNFFNLLNNNLPPFIRIIYRHLQYYLM